MIKVLVIGFLLFFILYIVNQQVYQKDSYIYPAEIPGHRPSLGDFLPTVGEENTGLGGYLEEDD